MNFITKLGLQIDLERAKKDLAELLNIYPWPQEDFVNKLPGNQIGVSHRPGAKDRYFDASGSLYDKKTQQFIARESDFTEINDAVGEYTKQILKDLSLLENTKFGRIRYMRLMPRTGLSIHADLEQRYHLVLETNPNALFGETVAQENLAAKCYHLPADGYFYRVDTTRPHFVYNGGWEPRVHLVICRTE